MMRPFGLVLNFDAELELASPDRPRSKRMAALCRELAEATRRELAVSGLPGVVLDPPLTSSERPPLPPESEVLCWMPTPRALATLSALGFRVPAAPAEAVLRAVNHRYFAAELALACDPAFPSLFASSADEALRAIGALSRGGPVRLKRGLGFAGRQQKRLDRATPGAEALTWIRASFEGPAAGLIVEPEVEILAEWSVHGVLQRSGHWIARGWTSFECDERGAFSRTVERGSEQRDELKRNVADQELELLRATEQRVVAAVAAAGYFGPLAFDAFRYRDRSGEVGVRSLSDLNARLTRSSFGQSLSPFDPAELVGAVDG